jgi:hypothetical protein
MAASTVRQIHAVRSGALNAPGALEWLAINPAPAAQRPRQEPHVSPEPNVCGAEA